MPLVSIVVPVYKVEKYLERCVKSLLCQTLHDIEIILVDDGSPDRCPQICDEYASRDERIKVVHKRNGGLSSARNAGLLVATGSYIGFVDSDDDVSLDMYERMLTIIEKYNTDFVMSDYLRIADDKSTSLKTTDIHQGLYTKQQIRKDIFPQLIMSECIDYGPLLSVCRCLYRHSFLKKYHIFFDEEVRWSEDNIFSSIVGYHCNSFYYMKGEGLYHYYHNQDSITTSYRKGAWQVYCTMNKHLHLFFDYVSDYDFSSQLKLHQIYYACNCIAMELGLSSEKAIEGIRTILNSNELQNAFSDFDLPQVSFKLKFFLFLMKKRCSKLIYWLKKYS